MPKRPSSPLPDGRRSAGSPDPWQGWKPFGIMLGGGILLVFLIEMVALVRALGDMQEGHERGGIWAMLLMIFATMFAVVVIGGGLFVAIRRQRRAAAAVSPKKEDG